jgi:hypothetical protein
MLSKHSVKYYLLFVLHILVSSTPTTGSHPYYKWHLEENSMSVKLSFSS